MRDVCNCRWANRQQLLHSGKVLKACGGTQTGQHLCCSPPPFRHQFSCMMAGHIMRISTHLQNLANEREPIAVHPAGLHAQEHIALLYLTAINDAVLLHSPHCKACHIILPALVEAWHFCRLQAPRRHKSSAAVPRPQLPALTSVM